MINHKENDGDENEEQINRYNINRPKSRDEHKYSEYKTCIRMMMLICIKQHLATCKGKFMEKLSNFEAELKKKHCLFKKTCNNNSRCQGMFHKKIVLCQSLLLHKVSAQL